MSLSLVELGAFGEASAHAETAFQAARVADRHFDLAWAECAIGVKHLAQGDFREAIARLEPSIERCRIHAPRHLPFVGGYVGLAYARAGRLANGIRLLEQSTESAWAVYRTRQTVWLGEAHLLAGRPAEALDALERALHLARADGQRANETDALRLLGDVHSSRHRPDGATAEAETCYREALSLATELGMRPLVAHCHLGLGKLYRRTGQREQAQEHLTTATRMYHEMAMHFWLEQAEAELHNLA